ncbi:MULTISPECIES: hypothetical protein [unclassified Streptomyces]|uniref:hypothetical protein n=1 Tax=unclassified Streptomyces TaxID=2593676 RepID=UPI001F221274|nr:MULTISPECIES: hypothetical protein [unclassified Streptomyces]MCF0087272.1 hypothetical protein [Streptomyces sp. MH192]MCF0099438.1 hypothetical protein [Streptomyces sp. MH191]
MAGSADSSDAARGCLVLVGLCAAVAVGWLVWISVMWTVAEWRWAWFLGCAAVAPAVAFALVLAWGERRPFVPSGRQEAWMTAVVTAVAAEAPVVVLVKGWGTATVALLLALAAGSALVFGPPDRHGARPVRKSVSAGGGGKPGRVGA